MITNEEYIKEYITTRGLSKSTYQSTKMIMNHYSKFQQLSIHELIQEADNEEEQGIRWKRRKLKTRLINYMNYLRENMTLNSAKTYLKIVKAFYNHHEIEIHKLPKLNEKNSIVTEPITYSDLPDKEIIKKAVELSEPLMKAIILFLSSSGISKVDALNITIQQFIDATYHYHHQVDLYQSLATLWDISKNTDIIPIFKARRQKTNKYYITFCTHEATMEILNYLAIRSRKQDIHSYDKLFKIEPHYYTIKFEELNDLLGLQKVGSYNRFRGHMLRKFHASALSKDGMDRYLINVLQGKSNGSVDDVYFFEDENRLKEEYIQHMHSLLIFSEVREVTVHSEEFLELKKENDELKKQVMKIQQMQDELNNIKEWFVMK